MGKEFHEYVPSISHMGDCHICGHQADFPIHNKGKLSKMADNMIERVASGVQQEHQHWGIKPISNNLAQAIARAAIKAMRQPTDGMIKDGALTEGMRMVDELLMFSAAHGKFIKQSEQGTPLYQAWQAMIDAALNEEGNE